MIKKSIIFGLKRKKLYILLNEYTNYVNFFPLKNRFIFNVSYYEGMYELFFLGKLNARKIRITTKIFKIIKLFRMKDNSYFNFFFSNPNILILLCL